MNFQKTNLKFYLENGRNIAVRDFFPIFQKWIQNRTLPGTLIDVADYSHVPNGPGVVLVTHEANLCMDSTDGRFGLLYCRKQPLPGTPEAQLHTLFRATLEACIALENESSLKGKLKFRGNEIQLVMNDRLLAPNNEETEQSITPLLKNVLAKLFPSTLVTIHRDPDPKERFNLLLQATPSFELTTLLHSLSA